MGYNLHSLLLLGLPISGNMLSLAYSASCRFGLDALECAAGQWSVAGPAERLFEGEIALLSVDESCFVEVASVLDNAINVSQNLDKVVVVPRGGCSFGRKALNAQR